MSEYGPGLSIGQSFMLDKERIRQAFLYKLVSGEDETGFVYSPCTKQEAEEYILSAYDNAVYQCQSALASVRAQERFIMDLLKKYDIPEIDYYQQFLNLQIEEMQKYQDYQYEGEMEEECFMRRQAFTVINGGKE